MPTSREVAPHKMTSFQIEPEESLVDLAREGRISKFSLKLKALENHGKGALLAALSVPAGNRKKSVLQYLASTEGLEPLIVSVFDSLARLKASHDEVKTLLLRKNGVGNTAFYPYKDCRNPLAIKNLLSGAEIFKITLMELGINTTLHAAAMTDDAGVIERFFKEHHESSEQLKKGLADLDNLGRSPLNTAIWHGCNSAALAIINGIAKNTVENNLAVRLLFSAKKNNSLIYACSQDDSVVVAALFDMARTKGFSTVDIRRLLLEENEENKKGLDLIASDIGRTAMFRGLKRFLEGKDGSVIVWDLLKDNQAALIMWQMRNCYWSKPKSKNELLDAMLSIASIHLTEEQYRSFYYKKGFLFKRVVYVFPYSTLQAVYDKYNPDKLTFRNDEQILSLNMQNLGLDPECSEIREADSGNAATTTLSALTFSSMQPTPFSLSSSNEVEQEPLLGAPRRRKAGQ